jgi:hypothetical protein
MPRRAPTPLVETPGRRAPPGSELRQPNERDESSSDAARSEALAPVQREQMEAARLDAEGPGRDTDCRSVPSRSPECVQPADPRPPDAAQARARATARDAAHRAGATHDPGALPVAPDGRPAD